METATIEAPAGTALGPGARRRAVTAGVLIGMFLAALEATVVGTAMPTVIAVLGGLEHYSWVFSAYLLTSTVTVPVWGKLADIYGRRPIYQLGIAVFLIGSALSGASTSMAQLIAFRAVQGLGAGALVPLAMTIIGDLYTPHERARMQGLFSAVWGAASVIGPLVGGFITDHLSWRWVFYLNLPFGLLAAAIVGLTLLEPPRHHQARIDVAGALTLMSLVTLLLSAVGQEGLAPALRVALLAGSAALGALFVRVERCATDPIVPFELFRERLVAVAIAAGFFIGMGMFGAITYVPLFAQGVQGVDATAAGSLLTPLMISWVTLSVVGGRALLHVGYRTTVLTGLITMLAGFGLLSQVSADTTRRGLQLAMILVGAGLGLSMLTLLIGVQQAVPRERRGVATSLNQFSRSVGGAIGVALMGALLTAGTADMARVPGTGGEGLPALMEPARRAHLPPAGRRALEEQLAGTLARVFGMAGGLTLLALGAVVLLPKDARVEEPAAEAGEVAG